MNHKTDMQAAIRNALEWTAGTLQAIVSGHWRDVKEGDRVSIGASVKTISDVLDMADSALACRPDAQADDARAADPGEELQGWSVTVERNGVRLLTIEKDSVGGVENIGDFAPLVRDCAEHLLSFIGRDAQADERGAFEAWWKDISPSNFDYASALAGYLARAAAPREARGVLEGWKLVPVERSYDMRAKAIIAFNAADHSGQDRDDALNAAYQAELAAAPSRDREQVGEAEQESKLARAIRVARGSSEPPSIPLKFSANSGTSPSRECEICRQVTTASCGFFDCPNGECGERKGEALSDDARECLQDVVSHYGNFVEALTCKRDAVTTKTDREYWQHELNANARMKRQAERALAASAPTLGEPSPSCDPADICTGCRCKFNNYDAPAVAQPLSEKQVEAIVELGTKHISDKHIYAQTQRELRALLTKGE